MEMAEYENKKIEKERLDQEVNDDFEGGLRCLLLFERQFGHRDVPSHFPYTKLHDWVKRWNPPRRMQSENAVSDAEEI